MNYSLFLAKIIGPYCVAASVGILLNIKIYKRLLEDFTKNLAILYLGGAIAFIVGMIIVNTHNIWVMNWRVLITIFGWAGLLKGIWLFLFPEAADNFVRIYMDKEVILTAQLVLVFVLGITLTTIGYFI